jgi:hypothetical protein
MIFLNRNPTRNRNRFRANRLRLGLRLGLRLSISTTQGGVWKTVTLLGRGSPVEWSGGPAEAQTDISVVLLSP